MSTWWIIWMFRNVYGNMIPGHRPDPAFFQIVFRDRLQPAVCDLRIQNIYFQELQQGKHRK